jgi:hypothetical protein
MAQHNESQQEQPTMQLNLGVIRIDGGTQPRAELRQDVVEDYAELMRAGAAFPPVSVFYDGQDYWLADGFHRFHAWRRARPEQPIDVDVIQGTLDDARWYSYGVNKTHGLRRTNVDKERAVRTALQHPKAAGLSNVQLAEHCGVHERTVRRYREKSEAAARDLPSPTTPETVGERLPAGAAAPSTSAKPKSAGDEAADNPVRAAPARPRTGRDGRTINTAKIGRRRVRSHDTPKTLNGGPISPRARPLIRGHSAPLRLISLNVCPDDPQAAAATLWEFFSRTFCEALVQHLSQFLAQEGEHECLFPPAPTTATNSIPATSM